MCVELLCVDWREEMDNVLAFIFESCGVVERQSERGRKEQEYTVG